MWISKGFIIPKAEMVRRRREARSVEYLFRDYDLHAVLENQREQMVQAINGADASVLTGRSTEEVADEFVRQFQVDPPELTEGAISVDVEEAQVDVSGDPRSMVHLPWLLSFPRAFVLTPTHSRLRFRLIVSLRPFSPVVVHLPPFTTHASLTCVTQKETRALATGCWKTGHRPGQVRRARSKGESAQLGESDQSGSI